jgi:hypothetical protein
MVVSCWRWESPRIEPTPPTSTYRHGGKHCFFHNQGPLCCFRIVVVVKFGSLSTAKHATVTKAAQGTTPDHVCVSIQRFHGKGAPRQGALDAVLTLLPKLLSLSLPLILCSKWRRAVDVFRPIGLP